uniref:Endonuclease, Uma2 family (Restriction endonuclease fold) n=1 Tax=Candidatus Kentrum sp. FM TaxID=2126340 RepID=A0A450TE77_9GAMM|nr:MAG: Endonuclease, Uma2 family (restriction endonuclease fold) [Candidatus Kentron sp. FM]VFJ67391.1 MAG: Endonuclease, Uma2 family (restriction endonuclease fold) [Candidatus Kentron sp. FM]VFK16242.1 MAG: Endonuclease, Uma2 family (restriction endonuclease fold) [Candidatus Kentron sp. FM]
MMQARKLSSPGPFTVNDIREEDRYELSNGHRIYCAPAGENHARRNLSGGSLLDSDPDVQWSGVDAGFALGPGTMRAPDVSVAPPPPQKSGWIAGVPPLAVEYADRGQNEAELQTKIQQLLSAGTRYVWVVRLTGPHRVEVYTPGEPMRLLSITDTLQAPGILRNPVPVRALFDRRAAHRVMLRNLLQREGYDDLDAVRREGKAESKAEAERETQVNALFTILAARGIQVDAETGARIRRCRASGQLDAWLRKAAVAQKAEDVFRQ